MPSLDDLRKRIKSVKSTQKITKAMKMVAAAKLRKAQENAEKGRPYSEKMNNIILNLSNSITDKENAPKLLVGTDNEKVHLCIVLTADRGLCGGFNSNIVKKAKPFFEKIKSEGKSLQIITVGSKGYDQLKRVYGSQIIEKISFKDSKVANYLDAEIVGKKIIELRKWNTNFRGEFLIHAPIKIRIEDCKRLKINKKLVTGAIIGKAELYEVKKYNSVKEIKADQKFHLASKNFHDKTFGFMLKNIKSFRIPIPWKGQLGFFEVDLPKTKIKNKEIVTDIIDEEYRYQWIGHH